MTTTYHAVRLAVNPPQESGIYCITCLDSVLCKDDVFRWTSEDRQVQKFRRYSEAKACLLRLATEPLLTLAHPTSADLKEEEKVPFRAVGWSGEGNPDEPNVLCLLQELQIEALAALYNADEDEFHHGETSHERN
jgi:hypothetical protein